MIKIKISCKTESDVSTYIARDWSVKMFRGYTHGEFFVAEKDNIQFVVRETDDGRISLEKLVNGEPIDTKFAASDGCGIGGTLYINDHREPERCYAFFRNEKLQDLLDCFGIPKLIFQKTSVGSDHFVMGYETQSTEEEIITDGTIEDNGDTRSISNAGYVYDVMAGLMILPQKYDIPAIIQSLREKGQMRGEPKWTNPLWM